MLQIEIDSIPIPWSPARVTSHGAFNPRGKQKNFAIWMIRSKYNGPVIKDYVVLDFQFIFPIPNSVHISFHKRYLENIEFIPTACDCTNLQKFYEDCLKKTIIDDDRNVVKISSSKLYGEKGKILIKIWTWEEYRNEIAFGEHRR